MRQWEVLAAKKEKNRWRQTVFPDGKKHFVNFFMHMIFAINSFCQRVYPCEGTGAIFFANYFMLLCSSMFLCYISFREIQIKFVQITGEDYSIFERK